MAPFEALYGVGSVKVQCWSDISETMVLGPQLIEDTTNQGKLNYEKVRAAKKDLQMSYVDLKRREEQYEITEKVLLGVSPIKGVMRFGKKGKLSPKFISPYEIVKIIGKVAYQLAIPNELQCVHDVFHVHNSRDMF